MLSSAIHCCEISHTGSVKAIVAIPDSMPKRKIKNHRFRPSVGEMSAKTIPKKPDEIA